MSSSTTMSILLRVLFVLCLNNLLPCYSSKFDDFYSINTKVDGDFIDNLIVQPAELIVDDGSTNKREKRSTIDDEDINELNDELQRIVRSVDKLVIQVEEWIFVLEENKFLSLGEDINKKHDNREGGANNIKDTHCKFYIGSVLFEKDSQASITICDKIYYYGYFISHGVSFIIEPIDDSNNNHIIYKAKLPKEVIDKDIKRDGISNNEVFDDELDGDNNNDHEIKRKTEVKKNVYKERHRRETVTDSFNLTGDINLDNVNFDFSDEDYVIEKTTEAKNNIEEDVSFNQSYDDYDYDLPPRPAPKRFKKRKHEDDEDVGYFVDTQWQTRPYTKSTTTYIGSKPKKMERWLEIALAVDYTVIDFHGKAKIKQYIMALMNIVSAIYKDASLDANLHLVMARLIFYDDKRDSVIKPGNAKRSLEDVNRWNYRLIGRLGRYEKPHDVAVWLTREYLGGPSGYAPVAGVCDRSRSTALNKDEGLASAFIIAHEMAHILGLTHDGDMKAGNKCDNEVSQGTIMAPTVSANFHRFTWSSCSKEEFHRMVKQWHCLLNPPMGKNHTIITPGTTESFTMDEQCRMEYGEGYGLCRNFELIEPCTYLWCGQKDSLQCITKKGAPAEGTQCGFDKWCVDGYCQYVDGRLYGTGIPRAGGWGQWSAWSKCSRPCGYGVKVRRRTCDNPSPAWGGEDCKGPTEEKEVCQQSRQCWESPTSDPKLDRCLVQNKDGRRNETWLPYEAEDEDDLSCRVSCVLWETGEVVRSKEFLPDGTPCTYDNPHHICVDGKCKKLGCDGIENSITVVDKCGVCNGLGNTCFENHLLFNKTQKKNMTRLLVLPRHSRDIRLSIKLHSSVESNRIVPYSLFHLTLRNKNKKLFKLSSRNADDVLDIGKSETDSQSPVWPSYQVGPSVVLAGSYFVSERPPGFLTLSTKGPLHHDIVVMLSCPHEYLFAVEVTVEANYTLGKEDVGRYKWILEEHMPCQCGVAPRPPPVYCVDTKRGNRTVHGSHCTRAVRPRAKPQVCNIRCDFHWIPGPWENCTAICGTNGTSHRQLYCVPVSLGPDTPILRLIKFMVEPKYCTKERPSQEQPCNIFPCPAYWLEGPWTKCSSACGPGISSRPLVCESSNTNDCGEMPIMRWRPCKNRCALRKRPELGNCHENHSPYCSLPSLARYCDIPSYRKLCCFTCKNEVGDYRENMI